MRRRFPGFGAAIVVGVFALFLALRARLAFPAGRHSAATSTVAAPRQQLHHAAGGCAIDTAFERELAEARGTVGRIRCGAVRSGHSHPSSSALRGVFAFPERAVVIVKGRRGSGPGPRQ